VADHHCHVRGRLAYLHHGLVNQFLEAVPAVFAETGQNHGVIRLVIGQDAVHDRDG